MAGEGLKSVLKKCRDRYQKAVHRESIAAGGQMDPEPGW